jgi:site-specific DNA recombinase
VSVGTQEVENRALCKRQGWIVARVITDNDRSASRHATKLREGYQEAKRALERGGVDVLVCWESSRAHRDLADYTTVRDLCAKNGVLFAYRDRVYDLTRSDDRLATGLDALLAEREADIIQERVMRGIRGRAAAGAPHGTVPFGFRRVYDPHTRALLRQVPDPTTAPIVAEIVRRIVHGDTLHGIAKSLNERHVPTPQQYKDEAQGRVVERGGWASSTIRRLLGSRSVVGTRTHHDAVHPEATWEPLVPVADYELARLILADPSRARHHRGVQVRHFLSGIAECGACGGWLRAARNRGAEVYQCAGRGPGTSKGHVSRRREQLEAAVVTYVVSKLSDPRLLLRLAEGADDEAATMAARELSGLRARLTQLEEDVAEGRMSGAAFGRIEAKLTASIENACARATPRSVPPELIAASGPDAPAIWDAHTNDVVWQRQVVRALVRVVVHRSSTPGSRVFDDSTIEIVDR